MSKYRVKHFDGSLPEDLEEKVNKFLRKEDIEVFRYTFHPVVFGGRIFFIGVLEYEVEDDQ